jgi:hypothetical protein
MRKKTQHETPILSVLSIGLVEGYGAQIMLTGSAWLMD